MGTMLYATSADGTRIGFERSGAGSPLVLVHGTSADRTRWAPVLPAFEAHHTVYAVDRRGRGTSGDAPVYSLEREYEDIAAVVDAVAADAGQRVDLFGHSYGALVSLEAAQLTSNVRRLVLYEPAFSTGEPIYEGGRRDRLEELLRRGDNEGVLLSFFRDVVGVSEDELAGMREAPSWQARIQAATTIPREFADAEYVFDATHVRRVTQPVLLLTGSESDEFLKSATAAVDSALPNSRVVVMPGQGHVATTTAPELVAELVLSFLAEPD